MYLTDAGDCVGWRPFTRRCRRRRRRRRGGHAANTEVDESKVDPLSWQRSDPPRRVDAAAASQLGDVVGQVADERWRVVVWLTTSPQLDRVHYGHRCPLTTPLHVWRHNCNIYRPMWWCVTIHKHSATDRTSLLYLCWVYLLTPMRVPGVKRSSASVCVCVCVSVCLSTR